MPPVILINSHHKSNVTKKGVGNGLCMRAFGNSFCQRTLIQCSALEKLFRPDKKNTPACQVLGISIKTEAVDDIQIYKSIHLLLKVLCATTSLRGYKASVCSGILKDSLLQAKWPATSGVRLYICFSDSNTALDMYACP